MDRRSAPTGAPDEFEVVVGLAAEAERRVKADRAIDAYRRGVLTVADLARRLAAIADAPIEGVEPDRS